MRVMQSRHTVSAAHSVVSRAGTVCCTLTDAGQLLAREHVDDAFTAEHRSHDDPPGFCIGDGADGGGARRDASALEIGIEEAQKLAAKVKGFADGLYLMPPFGNHHIAERVMEAVI